MTTQITNNLILNQPLEPGKETKTGEAQTRANQAAQETGQPTTTTATDENSSRCDFTNTARTIQQLEEAIADKPVIDPKRVAEAQKKIQNGDLAILRSNTEAQIKSAGNIAQEIVGILDFNGD